MGWGLRITTYILTIGSDITKFNMHVSMLIDSLAARGETTTDLLMNLFKGYQLATDKSFVNYIGRRLERFEEGETTTAATLMKLANNKFKMLKEGGARNAPNKQEEKILALQTEIKGLRKEKKDGKPILKRGYVKKPFGKKTPPTEQIEKPSWFFKEPKEDELYTPKTWKNKSWYFCRTKTEGKCDGQYRRHKPANCFGKAHNFVPGNKEKRKAPETPNTE